MNPYQRLKAWWFKPVDSDADVVPHDDVLPEDFSAYIETIELPTQSKGRVIATKHSVYQAGQHRTGGRVVKIMPKQLKQMKEAQERVEDD